MSELADFEVKIVNKFDLTEEEKTFINARVAELCEKFDMYCHEDQVTYSKKPPYKKYEDIPAGLKFYFFLEKYKSYFTLYEYYSYLERDINGRILRRDC